MTKQGNIVFASKKEKAVLNFIIFNLTRMENIWKLFNCDFK